MQKGQKKARIQKNAIKRKKKMQECINSQTFPKLQKPSDLMNRYCTRLRPRPI